MLRKVGKIIGLVILGLFIISFIYVMVIRSTGTAPSLFGYSIMRVDSDSMEPELKSGDIVLVQKTDPEKIQVNDVITYSGNTPPVENVTVTHQVVDKTCGPDGSYTFITRGIIEDSVNDPPIDESQIIGKVAFKVPVVGTIYDFFSHWYGMLALLAILLVAFSGDILNLINKIKDSKSDIPSPDEIKRTPDTQFDDSASDEMLKEADELLLDLDDPE